MLSSERPANSLSNVNSEFRPAMHSAVQHRDTYPAPIPTQPQSLWGVDVRAHGPGLAASSGWTAGADHTQTQPFQHIYPLPYSYPLWETPDWVPQITLPVAALTYTVPHTNPEWGTYEFDPVLNHWKNRALGHTAQRLPTLDEFRNLFRPKGNEASTPSPPPPPPPKCAICDEEDDLVPAREPRSNENFRERRCRGGPHLFCKSCMSAWIHAEVSMGKSSIKCPAEGCALRLSKVDVERLGAPEDRALYEERLTADIAGKTRDLLNDPVHAEWLQDNTKQCPTCSQLIEREAGCDDMMCLCGTTFCYRCAQATDESEYILRPAVRDRCYMCKARSRSVNSAAVRNADRALRALRTEAGDSATTATDAQIAELQAQLEEARERSRAARSAMQPPPPPPPSPPVIPGLARGRNVRRPTRLRAPESRSTPTTVAAAPKTPAEDEWVTVDRRGRPARSGVDLTPNRPHRHTRSPNSYSRSSPNRGRGARSAQNPPR